MLQEKSLGWEGGVVISSLVEETSLGKPATFAWNIKHQHAIFKSQANGTHSMQALEEPDSRILPKTISCSCP